MTEQTTDPIESLMEGLSPGQSSRLLAAVTRITTESYKAFGVTPTLGEVAALAQVRAMTLEGVEGDISNALFQLKTEAPSVVAYFSAASAANMTPGARGRFMDTGIISQDDIAQLPPAYAQRVRVGMTAADLADIDPGTRMNIGKALMFNRSDRNPAELNGVQDREIQAYTDSLPLEQLTAEQKMTRARKTGGQV